MMNKPLGLYIHLPFCLKKCGYCDFCSFPAVSEAQMARYTEALCAELAHNAPKAEGRAVDTVFFGGGTPTLLPLPLFEKLISTLYRLYPVTADAEITVEANPASADKGKLQRLRELGVNRLSIGVQSLSDGELSLLGRVHTAEEAKAFYADAIAAGFSNINLDLMYAIPSQTVESFAKTLDTALALSPSHLSVYSLILEEGTPFYQKKESLPLPDEDEEEGMRQLLLQKMAAAGYGRYEISNFAKEGYACRHNLHYWRNEEYLGFGVAAYSYFDGIRYGNGKDMAAYIASPLSARAEEERLTDTDRAYEYVLTRLRLCEGISLSAYRSLFGIDFAKRHRALLERFAKGGLLKMEGDRLFLTDEGMNLSNSILVSFMP